MLLDHSQQTAWLASSKYNCRILARRGVGECLTLPETLPAARLLQSVRLLSMQLGGSN
jgi:hypothetical protein